MTADQRLTLILTAIGIIGIPTFLFILRATVKWTRVESRLDTVIKDLTVLVKDKDKIHEEMLHQMADDRHATDRRLRWLEEHLWKRPNG